jgi:hypothetical protein
MNIQTFTDRLKKATSPSGYVRKMVTEAVRNGRTSTGYYQGGGRYTKAIDQTPYVLTALKKMGIEAISGNDAPRGGIGGNYVKLTAKGMKATAPVRAAMKADDQERKERAAIAHVKAQQAAIERNRQLLSDIETLRPFAEKRAAEILASKQLTGQAKSERQQAIMSAIVAESGHAPIDFWKTWTAINNV